MRSWNFARAQSGMRPLSAALYQLAIQLTISIDIMLGIFREKWTYWYAKTFIRSSWSLIEEAVAAKWKINRKVGNFDDCSRSGSRRASRLCGLAPPPPLSPVLSARACFMQRLHLRFPLRPYYIGETFDSVQYNRVPESSAIAMKYLSPTIQILNKP